MIGEAILAIKALDSAFVVVQSAIAKKKEVEDMAGEVGRFFTAKKKVEEQEKQIRELITWAYGTETYKEMMQMRRDIRAKRERIIYRRRKKRQRMLDISFLISALIFCGGIIWGMVSIIGGAR